MSDDGTFHMVGVLLAAGRSRRMGTPKQLMPMPGKEELTIIERSFDLLSTICRSIVVVAAGEASEIQAVLQPREFGLVQVASDQEMFASVKPGLRAAMDINTSAAIDGIALHPADMPFADPTSLQQLLGEFRDSRDSPVAVMPTVDGVGGHPVLIPRAILPRILEWNGSGGLRQFWIEHPQDCNRIPIDRDPGLIRDIDTPEDYRKAAK